MKNAVLKKSLRSGSIAIALFLCSTIVHAHFFKALPQTKPKDVYAIWMAPHFDFDTDSCLPDAAISSKGQQNGGLKPTGKQTGGCRHNGFMGLSNTYHRYVCRKHNGAKYCAHVYALYFQKDQISPSGFIKAILGKGHRHDFEYAVVWTRNGQPTHVSVSGHGKLSTKKYKDVAKNGYHPKIVYHKDGIQTRTMRFAGSKEYRAENPTGKWVRPNLASWFTMKGSIGNKKMMQLLSGFDYGNANLPVKHSNMAGKINKYKPSGYPKYSKWDMWGSR